MLNLLIVFGILALILLLVTAYVGQGIRSGKLKLSVSWHYNIAKIAVIITIIHIILTIIYISNL